MPLADFLPHATKREKSEAAVIGVAREIVERHFGKDPFIAKYGKKIENLNAGKNPNHNDIKAMILAGLALRMAPNEIERAVQEKFPDWNPRDGESRIVTSYYRHYLEVVDEVYVGIAMRVGEMYRFADKLHRIRVYNDLAESLTAAFAEKMTVQDFSDETFKIGNLLVKIMDRVNSEMPNGSAFPVRRSKIGPNGEETPHTEEETARILSERYRGQLPAGVALGVSKVNLGQNESSTASQ